MMGLKQEKAVAGEHGATIFQKSWSIYDLLAEKNYMHHREIYARVRERLGAWAGKSYALLDLGCGNARFLAPCLLSHPPMTYVGVDLSEAALEEAREHLAGLLQVALHSKEMVEALEAERKKYEVIFSGYAMHHLDSEKKERFLGFCFQRLAPGGTMLLVDVVREESERREDYIRRYLGFMRRDWTEVPGDELEEACAHVAAHDFPETEARLLEMARKAGFPRMERVVQFGPHHLWAFERTN